MFLQIKASFPAKYQHLKYLFLVDSQKGIVSGTPNQKVCLHAQSSLKKVKSALRMSSPACEVTSVYCWLTDASSPEEGGSKERLAHRPLDSCQLQSVVDVRLDLRAPGDVEADLTLASGGKAAIGGAGALLAGPVIRGAAIAGYGSASHEGCMLDKTLFTSLDCCRMENAIYTYFMNLLSTIQWSA